MDPVNKEIDQSSVGLDKLNARPPVPFSGKRQRGSLSNGRHQSAIKDLRHFQMVQPYQEEINSNINKRRDSNAEVLVHNEDESTALIRKRPTSFIKSKRRNSDGMVHEEQSSLRQRPQTSHNPKTTRSTKVFTRRSQSTRRSIAQLIQEQKARHQEMYDSMNRRQQSNEELLLGFARYSAMKQKAAQQKVQSWNHSNYADQSEQVTDRFRQPLGRSRYINSQPNINNVYSTWNRSHIDLHRVSQASGDEYQSVLNQIKQSLSVQMESKHTKKRQRTSKRHPDSDNSSSESDPGVSLGSDSSSFWQKVARKSQKKEMKEFEARKRLEAERAQQYGQANAQQQQIQQSYIQHTNPFLNKTTYQPPQRSKVQPNQQRKSQPAFMQPAQAKDPLQSREQWAQDLRKIKKKNQMKQRRKKLRFNPPKPAKRPDPGTFSRYHSPPLMLIHELLKLGLKFDVFLERKNFSDTVLLALAEEERVEHSGVVLDVINDNYLKNDYAFKPATKEEPVALQLGYEDLLKTTTRIQRESNDRYFRLKWTSIQIQNSYVPVQKPLPWEEREVSSSEDDGIPLLIQQMDRDFKKMNFRQHLSRSKSAAGLTKGNQPLEIAPKKSKQGSKALPKAKF